MMDLDGKVMEGSSMKTIRQILLTNGILPGMTNGIIPGMKFIMSVLELFC